jgi:predicted metalloprotease with PDZ domain
MIARLRACLPLILLAAPLVGIASSPGPSEFLPPAPLARPEDRPYPGKIRLEVDSSDSARRIVHVREVLTGIGGEVTLYYPRWLPGTHAPEGPIDRLAGLQITAAGTAVPWKRDSVDVFAFHVHPPEGATTLELEFDYLSATSDKVGPIEMSPDLLMLEWNAVVLYPGGYFARQIPVQVSLTLPAGWKFASALEVRSSDASAALFEPSNLETLIDSPLYAGRYSARLDLDPGGLAPVHLNLFADRQSLLAVKDSQLAAYRNLVQQAYRLFGSWHYAHYDFLYSLSDQIQQSGLEHQQSSEDGGDPESFTDWDRMAADRDLLPHEYTHSWNGKFRRPADLWTASYELPMRDDLLWVYEGQTQYWGEVLATRAGLWTHGEMLEQLALSAAFYQHEAGRRWRPLSDTTHDEIINPRRPQSWTDWQRFEDYYGEGALLWLEADTLIRERSRGRRSLDDFARAFFGIDDGSTTTVTYTLADVVAALNDVQPYDWAAFFHERLDSAGVAAPLAGIERGGYRLVYNDKPNEFEKMRDEQRKRASFLYSLGIDVDDKDGTLLLVMWESPAYQAKLIEGTQIVAVNGFAYSGLALREAVAAAKESTHPIELIVKSGERYSVVDLDYHEGLRIPHLERDPAVVDRLGAILAPRR